MTESSEKYEQNKSLNAVPDHRKFQCCRQNVLAAKTHKTSWQNMSSKICLKICLSLPREMK